MKLKSSTVQLQDICAQTSLMGTASHRARLTLYLILPLPSSPCRARTCPYCRRSRYAPISLSRIHKCYHCPDLASTSIHWSLIISILSVNIQLGTTHHVPLCQPEQPCRFLINLGLWVYFLCTSRFAESACSFFSPCCLSVIQLHTLTGGLPSLPLLVSEQLFWSSLGLICLFSSTSLQFLRRKGKLCLFTIPVQISPTALQKSNGCFLLSSQLL